MRSARLIRTAAVPLAALLLGTAACGSPAHMAAGKKSKIVLWTESSELADAFTGSMTRFNAAHPDALVTARMFENDTLKKKLRNDINGSGPNVFYNWGGAPLKTLVDKGKVADLTNEFATTPGWRNSYLSSVLAPVTFNGRIYGVPAVGMQPVVFFYDKKAFQRIGAQPPTTFDQLFALIPRFQKSGIIPMSLGGKQPWTELTWMEYLVDRIGGPGVFQRIESGDRAGWRDPAIVQAAQLIQKLVGAGAFNKDYATIQHDNGESATLVDTGTAAMELMGSFEYLQFLATAPDFVSTHELGWFPFPAVAGGKGDPRNVVGNPNNFYSVRAGSPNEKTAVAYVKALAFDQTYQTSLIGHGEVPALKGITTELSKSKYPDWLQFVYNTSLQAPDFQLSWDQALPAKRADVLLKNLARLFERKISPEKFVTAMSK